MKCPVIRSGYVHRERAVAMTTPFRGMVNLDVRDSTPDWAPYEQAKAADGAPNVVYIVLDDVGFAGLSCYGGMIDTPNIDRIAARGVRYNEWHTTALCSPTRSCLLTGRNHTTNGMACITEGAAGFPNGNGHIPPECATLAEVLVERGFSTAAVGKWHLTAEDEMNMASTKSNWPLGRGFERFYGFLGAETNQWYPDLIHDNHPVEQPYSPEEGYHLSVDITDRAIAYIDDVKSIAPDRPIFLYYAPGCAHAPHHVPKEWIEKYKGRFDAGYEQARETMLAKQKELGIVSQDTELPPVNPLGTPQTRLGPNGEHFPALDETTRWDTMSTDEQVLSSRMAEVYAGFLSHGDAQIGRLVDHLEEIGQLDNTIIIVVSDNGASGEGGPNGSVNEMLFMNGIPDTMANNMTALDELGGLKTYNHYSTGWAMAFNTPFKMWKRYASFEGGTADPCIISWPAGITSRGEVREQYHHAIDIVPTVLDCLDVAEPQAVRGVTQIPIQGVSMRYSFDAADAPATRHTQFYSMLGTRAIYHDGWKAVTTHPAISGWGHFEQDTWELYHSEVDRAELHDVAAENPAKLTELIGLWYLRGRDQSRVPARRPHRAGDLPDPTPATRPPARPLHLPARRGRGPRIRRGQRPQPVLHDRRSTRHRRRQHPTRCAVRPRQPVRRPRPVRQGQPARLRLQLRRHQRTTHRRHRGPPHRHGSTPVRQLRQDRRATQRRSARDPVAVLRRKQSRRGTPPDPTRQVRDRRRRTQRRTRRGRPRHLRLSRPGALALHRRHRAPRRRRRQRRPVR